jgi:hypothetical protein
MKYLFGDQDARALEYQSRCVTIAGRGHSARSADCRRHVNTDPGADAARGSVFRLWHSFREVPGVSDGALIAVFVIMLAVPS